MSEIDEGAEPEATPPASAPAELPLAPAMSADWRPLPPQAATTAMFGGAALGLLVGAGPALGGGITFATQALDLGRWGTLALVALVWLAVIALATWFAYRRWLATAWKLDETGLHLKRGRLWRKEVLVPRSRVQHLDIERGPIERRYGLATLIVHTAGTRQHALRLAGLPDEDAVALRDALVPDSNRPDDVL
jgi:membrane protein YdbS with pleckstrin-like domain